MPTSRPRARLICRQAKPWRWWPGFSRRGKLSGEGLDHGSGHGRQGLAHRTGLLESHWD
jgi:hypothetical protein